MEDSNQIKSTKDKIKAYIEQNFSTENIYKELLSQGIKVEEIQKNLQSLNDEKTKEDTSKKTIRLILTIGAILVGAGIFSFVASNWQVISRATKIVIILFFMLSTYSAGWYLKEKAHYSKTGDAFILLGLLIYGAGIFLVAQMYNVRANWPDGFILWMFGALALAFVMQMYSLFYFAILLGWVALIGQPFSLFNNVGSDSFLLTSTLILLPATAITLYTGYIFRKKTSTEFKDYY